MDEARNAAVFPVPVCALAARSRPARAYGRHFAWITEQYLNPSCWVPTSTSRARSRSQKRVFPSAGSISIRSGIGGGG